METDEKMSFYNSSPRSSLSFETTKSDEKVFSTIEITPSLPESLPEDRDGLRKRARLHLRSFCRHKSPKVVPIAPKDTAFSYAVIPTKLALQDFANSSPEKNQERVSNTALIIDCNKFESCIQDTIECALETFPKQNVFVVGYGNSASPCNNTNRICTWLGVRYIWIPTRSQATAQYVGIAAAHRFHYCLFIEGDVALPKDFPVLTDWLGTTGRGGCPPLKCIAYAEPNENDGPLVQSLEYRASDLPQNFFSKAGNAGCASFPHGAISLWERSMIEECFHRHTGYKSSPNWFLGVNLALVLEKKSSQQRRTGNPFRCMY